MAGPITKHPSALRSAPNKPSILYSNQCELSSLPSLHKFFLQAKKTAYLGIANRLPSILGQTFEHSFCITSDVLLCIGVCNFHLKLLVSQIAQKHFRLAWSRMKTSTQSTDRTARTLARSTPTSPQYPALESSFACLCRLPCRNLEITSA